MAFTMPSVPVTSFGEKLKIKDLLQEAALKNKLFIDITAVVAKVGDVKVSTEMGKVPIPAREIYLCDDSWAMIKLVARDFFGGNSDNFKSDQVIYIKNVKRMKMNGETVLATVPDTKLNHEVNTPEAASLRIWLSQNNLEFKQNGLKGSLMKRFINVSYKELDNNLLAGSIENLNNISQFPQCTQSANTITVSQINGTTINSKNISINGVTEKKRKHQEEDVNMKIIKIDLTDSDFAILNASSNNTTQRKDSDITINRCSNTESAEDTEKIIKKELIEKEYDIEVIDDDKDFIVSETYSALMTNSNNNSLKNWNTREDKYLINFLSKHYNKPLPDDIYLQLFQANLDVFQGFSIDELKSRAYCLASAKNYIYLLQLCGGRKIQNEKEKCIFTNRVEQLRRVIRIKRIKE